MNIDTIVGGVKTWVSENRNLVIAIVVVVGLVGLLGLASRGCAASPAEPDLSVPEAVAISTTEGTTETPEVTEVSLPVEEAAGASETAEVTEEDGMTVQDLPAGQETVYETVTTDPDSAD